MKIYKEDNLIKGWFVGNFTPTCFSSDVCEVAVKRYKSQDYEKSHFHKIATEITFIIDGTVSMNNIEYIKGDIIVIEPNESTDFLCLTDVTTVVVKVPCVQNDKYEDTK